MGKEVKTPYCAISGETYKLLCELYEGEGKEEAIKNILKAVCDYFFKDEPQDLNSREDFVFYNRFLDFAVEKEKAWYRRHKNFLEDNPKKKQR